MGAAAGCARPLGTLAAEKNFSDAHVVRKMTGMIRRLRAANSARLLTRGKIKGLFIQFPAALIQCKKHSVKGILL